MYELCVCVCIQTSNFAPICTHTSSPRFPCMLYLHNFNHTPIFSIHRHWPDLSIPLSPSKTHTTHHSCSQSRRLISPRILIPIATLSLHHAQQEVQETIYASNQLGCVEVSFTTKLFVHPSVSFNHNAICTPSVSFNHKTMCTPFRLI